MKDDEIPLDLWIAAQTRSCAREGVSAIVTRKGACASGTLILKINRLDGTADLYSQIRLDEERVWMNMSAKGPLPEAEADATIEREASFDPDLWVVEIEDKQGRTWFQGRVVNPD